MEVGDFYAEQLIIHRPDMPGQLEPGLQLPKHVDFALQAGKLLADMPYIGVGRLHLQQRIGVSAALVSRELGRNANALGNVTSQSGNGKQIDGGSKGDIHFKIALSGDLLHVQPGLFRQAAEARRLENPALCGETGLAARQVKAHLCVALGKQPEPHAHFQPNAGNACNRQLDNGNLLSEVIADIDDSILQIIAHPRFNCDRDTVVG